MYFTRNTQLFCITYLFLSIERSKCIKETLRKLVYAFGMMKQIIIFKYNLNQIIIFKNR